jgi:hypothetical protein
MDAGPRREGPRVMNKLGCALMALVLAIPLGAALGADRRPGTGPFDGFDLPVDWEARFWAEPAVKALRELDAKGLAALVPEQAGFRHCRCPSCDAGEKDDPLSWSAETPDKLTCRRCEATFPNDKVPAKVEDKVPEEVVEILPGKSHHYPYHLVAAEKQRYPDERVYLAAKRDYEAREFLAKAVLYAAVRYHEQPREARDPALAMMASVLLLRFAQVYPSYATHYDQPGQPKYLQKADLPPPYRAGYRTAKWDWTGALDVPLNLVIAYALIRDGPAVEEAGRLLSDPQPRRTIERGLFRASADFILRQPEDDGEMTLYAVRGLLAAGRVLGDEALVRGAMARLDGLARRGFYHDGLWRQADPRAHRRVMGILDGWIDRLLAGSHVAGPGDDSGAEASLALARAAEGVALVERPKPEVRQVSWPIPSPRAEPPRRAALLGGSGLARLAVGSGADALDLELRGFGDLAGTHYDRLALRLAVGGRTVLGDLDDLLPSPDGFEKSTASHNAVVVDGLNQRETPDLARQPSPGADILFFAADPDLQVATFDDARAYPQGASRYRHTVVAAAGPGLRYAVSVFEVHGGLQHDQLFHVPPGLRALWKPSVPMAPGPRTLLPESIPYVPTARAEDGRWFLQAYGAFSGLAQGRIDRPAQVGLSGESPPPIRLHVLNDEPLAVFAGASADPSASASDEPGRGVLVLRRRSADGSALKTTFVTAFEPNGASPALQRVGGVASPPETVVLILETAAGPEHLVINLRPGTEQTVRLSDGQPLRTDALVVRATPAGPLVMAGGTFAEAGARRVHQSRATGTLVGASRERSENHRGWFESEASLPEPETLTGRILLIRHGDGTTRGWTLDRVEALVNGRSRLYVREEPGFLIDPDGGRASYYQFPGTTSPGPHRFRVAKIAR